MSFQKLFFFRVFHCFQHFWCFQNGFTDRKNLEKNNQKTKERQQVDPPCRSRGPDGRAVPGGPGNELGGTWDC